MIITLVGMPAAGKSCMSRAITKRLGMRAVDGDKVIVERVGMELWQYIEQNGLEAFKRLEAQTLMSIDEDDIILAPGGSAIYYDDAMTYLKSRGPVVYLYVSFETMKRRLGDYSKRGMVLEEGKTLRDMYDERCLLLEKYADITINCDGNKYPVYQQQLIEELEKYTGSQQQPKLNPF